MKRIGFSLVEILVVLVIIGILVGLILPNALRAIREGNVKACASNLRAIDTAIQVCYSRTRDAQQCDSAAEIQGDMDGGTMPTCPFGVAYVIPAAANTGAITSVTKAGHFSTWPTVPDPSHQ